MARRDGVGGLEGLAMVTIKEIARAVGVSSTTVSRVLNCDPTLSVSHGKRQAIVETAESLNYLTPRSRNRLVSAAPWLSPGLAKIALIHFLRPAEELADPYYVGVRLGIENRCQALKIELVKAYRDESPPDAMLMQGAAGIIAVGNHSSREIALLRQDARSLVFADFCPVGDSFDCVECDLRLATRRLLQSLFDLGYRRIGFIGDHEIQDDVVMPLGEKRCAAYIDWMREKGLFDSALCLVDRCRLSFEGGYQLARDMLAGAGFPEILVTANDNMAIGAYRAIMEKGLSIPRDIGVASFNDIPAAQFLAPPLSTVKIHAERIGETAVDLLLEQAAGREFVKKVTISTEMIWRESCRAPRA